jgi:hypothetical protein
MEAVLSVCFSSLRACQTQRMLAWVAKGNDNIECQLETPRSQNRPIVTISASRTQGGRHWYTNLDRSLRTKP